MSSSLLYMIKALQGAKYESIEDFIPSRRTTELKLIKT